MTFLASNYLQKTKKATVNWKDVECVLGLSRKRWLFFMMLTLFIIHQNEDLNNKNLRDKSFIFTEKYEEKELTKDR